ncbi:AMP-binding protein [Alcanivorax marinus]|uniref:AMP-binding protein n=1 Tax=Alloalcanivorax marinus TaxID=1177169 RepID=A0A9Q3UR23_9GAMM|nr:long-chain-fatty-acid--CoA ligase [Alloalcanivorax marinus]MCC4309493.1 AMP-binding protein [Alloalcanivorax marinus]
MNQACVFSAPHWPPRLSRTIHPPRTSLWDNVAVSARRYPDKVAIRFFDRGLTYQDLYTQCEALAGWLHRAGVRAGDRVPVMMQNCPQLVIAHYAVMRANAVVVPVNPMNRAAELEHCIRDAGARLAICSAELADEMVRASEALPESRRLDEILVTRYGDGFGEVNGAAIPEDWRAWLFAEPPTPMSGPRLSQWDDALHSGACPPVLDDNPATPCLLPYTSGTTGAPKGCVHHHTSIMHNAVACWHWINGDPDTVMLAVLPLFHITGLVCVMHGTLYGGGTLVMMPRWHRDLACRLIEDAGITHWLCIPTMVVDLLGSPDLERYDLSRLAFIGGGGAAMPEAVAERLREIYGLAFVEGYGLTETSGPTHMNPPQRPKLQCLGIPFVSTEVRVLEPDSHVECAEGENGEIAIHGPQVFQGYWNNEDATRASFVVLDGKRFFLTGDLGHRDADGYFHITDRIKRMINAAGYKVWPAEVENILFRHPGIQEACVVAARDPYRGETVKAVVVRRHDHPALGAEDIIDWSRAHMSAYKVPRIVDFVDELPKNGSGKVMWRALL